MAVDPSGQFAYVASVLAWLDEIGSNIAAEFLERWPTLEKLQRARPATIERFFIDHNSRDSERIAERLEQIRKAVLATTDLPGTVLTRSFKGKTVKVCVLPDGFRYQDRRFRSLSAVAEHITGTRWNGYVFFSLQDRGRQRRG